MKERRIEIQETANTTNHEQEIRYGETVVINPPLYAHGGRLSVGQLTSLTSVDVTYRYFLPISTDIRYASSAYNLQGKPVETRDVSNIDLAQFTEEAKMKTAASYQQIESQKESLGMAKTGVEFVDTKDVTHRVVQQRFLELYQKGFIKRDRRNLFLDTELILQTYDIRELLKGVEFHPANLLNTLYQLLNDATKPVALTKNRLFATPLPFYICDGCNKDFVPEGKSFPYDPRFFPAECPCCNNNVINTPRDTIAPLFDLTQQRSFLSQNSDARVVQICGRNVLTNYIFYSLMVNVALDGKLPFDVLVTYGYLNDNSGRRMSRRNGNMIYVDELFPQYHPDAIRYSAIKALTQNSSSSNFDMSQLKAGQKLVYRIGNLRKFFTANGIFLAEIPLDNPFWSKYQRVMEKFDYKHAFSLVEAYLADISTDIAHEREIGEINIADKAVRYKTAVQALHPFLPIITAKSMVIRQKRNQNITK